MFEVFTGQKILCLEPEKKTDRFFCPGSFISLGNSGWETFRNIGVNLSVETCLQLLNH